MPAHFVEIFNPCRFIFDLNLFAFKFKLHVQNLFKFKTNSYLNFLNLFNPSLNFLFNLVFHLIKFKLLKYLLNPVAIFR